MTSWSAWPDGRRTYVPWNNTAYDTSLPHFLCGAYTTPLPLPPILLSLSSLFVVDFQYGYVRPARVALEKEVAVDPPVASNVSRLPVRAKTGAKPTTVQMCDKRGGTSDGDGGGGGVVPAGSDATPCGETSFCQQKQQQQEEEEGGDGPEDGGGAVSSSACVNAGTDAGTTGGEDQDQDHLDEPSASATRKRAGVDGEEASADELSVGAATPSRRCVAGIDDPEEEEEPGSPPTPTSPGLADWEITEVRFN